MKFEKLNESSGKGSKMFLYGLITGVGLLIIFNLFLTKAKYKVVDSAKLVNSTINYSSADLNVIAMYKNDGEKDELIKEVPKGYYDIDNERSYCKIPDSDNPIKDKITYDGKEVNIKITKKGTKCYVYFIPAAANTLADLKLKSNTEEECPAINSDGSAEITGIEDSKSILCKGVDDYGDTYYFRGKVENNWVKIDNIYWRIIRINGDGTIRLIYSGKDEPAITGDATQISTSVFNENFDDNKYVGYMYGGEKEEGSSPNYAEAHGNKNISNILGELKTWWTGSTFPEDYKKYVDGATGFCNDRTSYTGTTSDTKSNTNAGFGNKTTYYGSYVRATTNKKPSFKCHQMKQDLFTTSDNEKGNKALSNVAGVEVPVGLITADEVMYAGGVGGKNNIGYYLYTNEYYWTISPHNYPNANMFRVDNNGLIGWTGVNNTRGVRPVINLKADTPFEIDGDGSTEHPFTVKLN